MSRPLVTPHTAARITGLVRIAPVDDLRDLVEHHWIVAWDNRGQRPVEREVLPDPCVNIAVEPAGRLVYGVGSGHSVHELAGKGMVIGTKFRPGGFSGFRPEPVAALSGRVLTLPEAFGAAGERLDAALDGTEAVTGVIAEITAFMRSLRPAPDPQRALAMRIVEAMRAAPPRTRVSEIAFEFGASSRGLQRLFADHVGATPGQVLQRFRRQHAIDRLSNHDGVNLARVAAELGYFDQAHLARDFRRTLGRSPSAVVAAQAQRRT